MVPKGGHQRENPSQPDARRCRPPRGNLDDVDRRVVYLGRDPGLRAYVPFGRDVTSICDELSELGRVATRPFAPGLRHADAGGDARLRHGGAEMGQDGVPSVVLPRQVPEHRDADLGPGLQAGAAAALCGCLRAAHQARLGEKAIRRLGRKTVRSLPHLPAFHTILPAQRFPATVRSLTCSQLTELWVFAVSFEGLDTQSTTLKSRRCV